MRILTLSSLALLSMGCSFIFVRPPPSGHEQLAYFDCMSSAVAPTTDVTNAVVDGLFALAVSESSSDSSEDSQTGFATGVAIIGAVHAASALYGFITTAECDNAKAQLAERVHQMQAQRDELLKARAPARPEFVGCRRDADCKGERVCVTAICVNPPAAPPAPASAAPAAPPAAPPSATP